MARAGTVTVSVAGTTFSLRRATLLGASLIKARALMVHADPDTQRQDLIRLLALINDVRTLAAELDRSERQWLPRAADRLAFTAPSGVAVDVVRRAQLAYQLLVRGR